MGEALVRWAAVGSRIASPIAPLAQANDVRLTGINTRHATTAQAIPSVSKVHIWVSASWHPVGLGIAMNEVFTK
jgi:hypothetical protein